MMIYVKPQLSTMLKKKMSKRIFLSLMFIQVVILVNNSAYAATLLDSNFESGEYASYGWVEQGNKKYSVEKDSSDKPVPVCSGNTMKFNLNFSDTAFRSHLSLEKGPMREFKLGKEYWISFAIYLPDSYAPDFAEESLFSLHGRPDLNIGEGYRRAVLGIRTVNDSWLYFHATDAKKNSGPPGDYVIKKKQAQIGKFETGKWTEFVINMKLSYLSDGFLKIWKDGIKVVDTVGGIGYNDDVGPYAKTGIYKRTWDLKLDWGKATDVSSRTVYIDQIRIDDANSTYEKMAPNCIDEPSGLVLIKD